jgi:hypothetical protein
VTRQSSPPPNGADRRPARRHRHGDRQCARVSRRARLPAAARRDRTRGGLRTHQRTDARGRPVRARRLAPLPSTAIMLASRRHRRCPVRVLCTPPMRSGAADPAVLVAARKAGVDQVFKAGGAQAIAAMAYGTATVPKCDKLFGPGNAWVTAAKLLVAQRRRRRRRGSPRRGDRSHGHCR